MSSSYSQQRNARQEEQDMQSYSPYSNPDSADDAVEDENAQLRSQALNSDGTPKRPMNAFMIFARRRRPQVSSANQMMRTGEISKILSKEWNTMPMSQKQFYLDQAKKLKENFNSKYPDYVYRRRPNNSRKKRRADSAPYDTGLGHEYPDDYDGVPAVDPHTYRLSYGFGGNTVSATSSADAAYYSSRPHHDTLSLSGPGSGGGPHGPGGASLYNPHPNYAADSEDQFPPLSLWPPSSNHHHQPQHAFPSKIEGGFHSPKDLRLEPAHANHHPSHHAFPKLGPAFSKVDPWAGDPLRISSRRGLHPLPLLPTPISHGLGGGGGASNGHGQSHHTHHVRNWSDSTGSSSVSPPSSAGSGGFPPGFGGSTNGGTGAPSSTSSTTVSGSSFSSSGSTVNGNPSSHGFQTLTAPFFPGGSSASSNSASGNANSALGSPSVPSISTSTGGSSASFYSNTRGEAYDPHSQSSSTHQRYPTLALSPASVAQSQNNGLWSSMRTKPE